MEGEGKMLKPAQLYAEKLREENIRSWYRPENIYWNGWAGESQIELPDDNGSCHCFVSVDKNDDVTGYITYNVDWAAMSAHQFGIISYKKNNLEFAKDLYKVICDCFYKYHFNRIGWCCYADNPAIRGYRNFIKKHGGRECGYYRQIAKLMDGQMHDSVQFEIMADEFKQ